MFENNCIHCTNESVRELLTFLLERRTEYSRAYIIRVLEYYTYYDVKRVKIGNNYNEIYATGVYVAPATKNFGRLQ